MAGNNPPWKTDVHRAPTKKWAEAKSYNYEGDDWGGYDEYNEYGTYDGPPLPHPPKQTGLRHRGQSVSSQKLNDTSLSASQAQRSGPSMMRTDSFEADDENRNFSAASTQSNAQQIQGQPESRYIANEERTAPKSEDNHRQEQYAPREQHEIYNEQQQTRDYNEIRQQPHQNQKDDVYARNDYGNTGAAQSTNQASGRGYEVNTHQPSAEFQQRRDFSTSATSQPPESRVTSVPAYSTNDVQRNAQFPPRKSSLSQLRPPHLASLSHTQQSQPQPTIARTEPFSEPATEALPPSSQNRSPFIRPADIYKRLEEERERERQATEARRPSTDSTSDLSARTHSVIPATSAERRPSTESSSDRSARSNFIKPPDVMARTNSISPARLDTHTPETQESTIQTSYISASSPVYTPAVLSTNAGVRPSLTTIPEQRSEYGLMGFSVSDPVLARAIGANLYGKNHDNGGNVASGGDIGGATSTGRDDDNDDAGGSPPSLPQLNRISGFGSDMWGISMSNTQQAPASNAQAASETDHDQLLSQDVDDHEYHESGLQHQPSSGFRTAVAHAFDRSEDRKVPRSQPSNEDRLNPMGESDLSRSNTDSTAGISPIIGRFPARMGTSEQMDAHDETTTIPTRMIEEHEGIDMDDTRPISTGALRETRSTFRRTHSRDLSAGSISSAYRRNLELPSPGNSPARTPNIENEMHFPQGSAGHIESVETDSYDYESKEETAEPELPDLQGTSLSTREADLANAVNAYSDAHVPGASYAAQQARTDFIESRPESDAASSRMMKDLSPAEAPQARAGSPSKGKGRPLGRVREIAEKYDDLTLSKQNTAQSPTGSISSWTSSRRRSPSPKKNARGGSGHNQAYGEAHDGTGDNDSSAHVQAYGDRPRLPGEWISYADTPNSNRQSYAEDDDDAFTSHGDTPKGHDAQSEAVTPTRPQQPLEEVDFSPNTAKRPLEGKTLDSSDNNPMSALAAAGSAMAASLMSTMGLTSPASPPSETESESDRSWNSSDDGRTPDVAEHAPVISSLRSETRRIGQSDTGGAVESAAEPGKEETSADDPTTKSQYFSPDSLNHQRPSTAQPEKLDIPTRHIQPSFSSVMSTESSPEDTENDRLSKQIVRSLSPTTLSTDAGPSRVSQFSLAQRSSMHDSRESTLLPREYDSYWAEKSAEQDVKPTVASYAQKSMNSTMVDQGKEPEIEEARRSMQSDRTITPPIADKSQKSFAVPPMLVSQPGLLGKRFSFEKHAEPEPFSQSFDNVVSPVEPVETMSGQGSQAYFHGTRSGGEADLTRSPPTLMSRGPYVSPPVMTNSESSHAIQHGQSTTYSQEMSESRNVPIADEATSVKLRSRETDLARNAEAGPLKPIVAESRSPYVSRDAGLPVLPPMDFSGESLGTDEDADRQATTALRGSGANDKLKLPELPSKDDSELSAGNEDSDQHNIHTLRNSPIARERPSSVVMPSDAQSELGQKLVPFKDIMAMKHSGDRIRNYQETREDFASMHTGLNDWLSFMVKSNPDSAHIEPIQVKPTAGRAGMVLHKISPSVAKFTRSNTSGGSSQQQPYYQQYLDSAAMVPGQGSADASTATSSEEHQRSSATGQSKGKDILHTAGILGGRATSSAKGFFAKGKSKFKAGSSEKNFTLQATDQQEAESPLESTRSSSSVAVHDDQDQASHMIPRQIEEPSTIIGTAISGDFDIPAGYGAAQLAPQVPVLPNDDSLAPRISAARLETALSDRKASPPSGSTIANVHTDSIGLQASNGGAMNLTTSDAVPLSEDARQTRQNIHATGLGLEERQSDQQINLVINSPEETATAGMTKWRPAYLKRDSVSTLDSCSDSTATPVSEIGVFGARGLALWEDTSPEALHGSLPGTVGRRSEDSVTQLRGHQIPTREQVSTAPDVSRSEAHEHLGRGRESVETVRGLAIGTPADLDANDDRRQYFEDIRASSRNYYRPQDESRDPVTPVSRPDSTIASRRRPMSPLSDSEIGHLQPVPQNQQHQLIDAGEHEQRPFVFNFRGISEDSSIKPDDSASQRPRDSIHGSIIQKPQGSVHESSGQRGKNSAQDSNSDTPRGSVHGSTRKPLEPTVAELEDHSAQRNDLPRNNPISERANSKSRQVSGPAPPSNIEQLPASVQNRYSQFDNQANQGASTQIQEKSAIPQSNHNEHEGAHRRENATEYHQPRVDTPAKSEASPAKRRMSPFERFRSRSRSRGRTTNDQVDAAAPPVPQGDNGVAGSRYSTMVSEPMTQESPTLRRRRRLSSPFTRLRGRSRPRSEIKDDQAPIPPLPQTSEDWPIPQTPTTKPEPVTQESFFASSRRRLSSPFRRLRSRSRPRSGGENETAPPLPSTHTATAPVSANHPVSVLDLSQQGLTRQAASAHGGNASEPNDSGPVELPSRTSRSAEEPIEPMSSREATTRVDRGKPRDRSLSWNRLRKSLPQQPSHPPEVPTMDVEKQRRSWGGGLTGWFGSANAADVDTQHLVARDSQHHLANFEHNIPAPISRSKSQLTLQDSNSNDHNPLPSTVVDTVPGSSSLATRETPGIKQGQPEPDSDQVRVEHCKYLQSRNIIRRKPTTVKRKFIERAELPGEPRAQFSPGNRAASPQRKARPEVGSENVTASQREELPSRGAEAPYQRQVERQTPPGVRNHLTDGNNQIGTLSQPNSPLALLKTLELQEPLDFSPNPTSPTPSSRRASLHYRPSSAYIPQAQSGDQENRSSSIYMPPYQSSQRQRSFQNEQSRGEALPASPSSVKSYFTYGQHLQRRQSGSQPSSPIVPGPYTLPSRYSDARTTTEERVPKTPIRVQSPVMTGRYLPQTPNRVQSPIRTGSYVPQTPDRVQSPIKTGPYIVPARSRPQSPKPTHEQRGQPSSPVNPPPRSPFRPSSVASGSASPSWPMSNPRSNMNELGGKSDSHGYFSTASGVDGQSSVAADPVPASAGENPELRIETTGMAMPSSEAQRERRISQEALERLGFLRELHIGGSRGVTTSPTNYSGSEWRHARSENE